MDTGPASLEERLERGEVIYYPVCPFPLPEGPDLEFLLAQRLSSRVHKNISFDPHTGRAGGFARQSPAQAERVRALLADFARSATGWLAGALPRYAAGWRPDRVSYRPEEEEGRDLGWKSRNDLLHVDAFPSRPTNGWRILRLFANVNPAEPRVWVTAETFGELLARYGAEVTRRAGQGDGWLRALGRAASRLIRPGRPARSAYDTFMLRFHDFLKANEEYQGQARKRTWSFPPGSAWMVFTDTATHSVLRGRFALEHSYFVDPATLALPAESPASLLARAWGRPVLHAA
jgi:hypothetical protein